MRSLVFVLAILIGVVACNGKDEEATLETIETATSAEPELPSVRSQSLQGFRNLLEMYEVAVDDEKQSVSSGSTRKMETAHLVVFYIHSELQCAYSGLNESEKRVLFADEEFSNGAPGGMYLGVGGPTTSVAGIPLDAGNPRTNFEEFLRYSFFEVDYMSAFQVTDEEQEALFKGVMAQLEERGFVCLSGER